MLFLIQLVTRLRDYLNRIKTKAEQVVVARFKELHSDDPDAIHDRDKRIQFGANWCDATSKEYRFIWRGLDKPPVSCANCMFLTLSHDPTTGKAFRKVWKCLHH